MNDFSFVVRTPENEAEWEQYYQCRWELLRKPWDQPKGSEKDENEDDAYHVLAVDQDNEVFGVGRIHFVTPTEAQVRYMAVKEDLRAQGVGSLILTQLEQYAIKHGAKKILLYARENALDFYLKRGYFSQGPAHNLYGEIPHFHMTKKIEN